MPSVNPIPGYEPTQFYKPPSHNSLAPGTRLNDYEIVRVLGEGGFSIVYMAQDQTLERPVAIKEYLPASLAVRGQAMDVALRTTAYAETFAQGLVSFINEARLLARFDHPSLVRVHHFWKANSTAYMVMPYLEGSTLLAARIAMKRPPDEAWLQSLLSGLLGALEVLHAASCFHRDIAPDNILLMAEDKPLLLDFGAARRVIGEKTQQLTAILKPAYAPIEQYAEAAHLQQGAWTDLYALAAVARFCITGTTPVPSTVRAVHDEMPPLVEEVRRLSATFPDLSYSAPFLAAIDWALGLRPSDRPQTVAEFREALGKTYISPTIRAVDTAPPIVADDEPPLVPAQQPPDPAEDAVKRMLDAIQVPAPAPSRSSEPVWAASRPHVAAHRPSTSNQRPLRQAALWGVALLAFGVVAVEGWKWNQNREVLAAMSQSVASEPPGAGPPAGVAPAANPQAAQPAAVTPQSAPAPARAAPTGPVAGVAPSPAAQRSEGRVVEAPPPAALPAVNVRQNEQPAQPQPQPPATSRVAEAGANARTSVRQRPAAPAEPDRPDNPRAVCAPRQQFALYYCMQTQCQNSKFYAHPQCVDLRRRDEVN